MHQRQLFDPHLNGIVGKRRWSLAIVGVIAAAHFLASMDRFAPAIATPDANGYLAQAARIAETGRPWFVLESDLQYIDGRWASDEAGRIISQFPPGLAALVSPVYGVLGYRATLWIDPVLAALSLLGLFLLLRQWMRDSWAVAGVLALAVNPVFNDQVTWANAHVAVTFFLVWGLYLFMRWARTGRWWELLAGAILLGCIPAIRTADAAFGLGFAVFILWRCVEARRPWWHVLIAAGGVAVPLVPLGVFNYLAFGSFHQTGYRIPDDIQLFGFSFFVDHFLPYIRVLTERGLGPLFWLGAAGMVAMCADRGRRADGLMLVLVATSALTLSMAIRWVPVTQSLPDMRYLLATFVCYIAAGLWLLDRLTNRLADRFSVRLGAGVRWSAIAGITLLQIAWSEPTQNSCAEQLLHQKRLLGRVADTVEQHVPDGSVIIAQPMVLQHLDFIGRWRLVDKHYLRPAKNAPPSMVLSEPMFGERPSSKRRRERFGNLDRLQQEALMVEELQGWAGECEVYFVGVGAELARLGSGRLGQGAFEVIAHVPLPKLSETVVNECNFLPDLGGAEHLLDSLYQLYAPEMILARHRPEVAP